MPGVVLCPPDVLKLRGEAELGLGGTSSEVFRSGGLLVPMGVEIWRLKLFIGSETVTRLVVVVAVRLGDPVLRFRISLVYNRIVVPGATLTRNVDPPTPEIEWPEVDGCDCGLSVSNWR